MSLDAIANSLEERKVAFLDDLESSIYRYIASTKKQCVAVVEKIPRGTNPQTYTLHLYEMHADSHLDDFVEVLFRFMVGKKYNNHELDSALTEPVLKIVEDKYVKLYHSADSELSAAFLQIIVNDHDRLTKFVSRLTNKLSNELSAQARSQVIKLIVHNLREAASSQVAQVIGHQVAVVASTAVGTQVAMTLGHVLANAIYMHCGQAIAHFVASVAFKKLLIVLMHKMLVGAITAAVLHFLAANFGVAMGSSVVGFIVIPIIATILVVKIIEFPEKLGKEVSKKVRAELDQRYNELNKSILTSTFEDVLNGDKLLEKVAQDKDVESVFQQLGKEIISNSF